jgi:hypothetical protein
MEVLAMEKRTATRYETDASVVCSYLTSNGNERVFDGTMRNYGACGMYAELKSPFRRGTILLVKTRCSPSRPMPSPLQEGFRSVSLAEVKWSQPLSREGETLYGIGMKYI